MRERGFDYFENSRRATYAQRAYAIANPMGWKLYGENIWGLTASDGPSATQQDYAGQSRAFRHYSARGAGLADAFDDGTIAPTAAAASLPFAPEIVIPAVEEMHDQLGAQIYSTYGFLDAFNPSFTYDVPLKTGHLIPGFGWVASDYIGIDQGPIIAMIENYRDDFVWKIMRKNPYIRRGLQRAGFTGGWLEPRPSPAARSAGGRLAVKRAIGAVWISCGALAFRSCIALPGVQPSAIPDVTVIKFWTIGREGEVVRELLDDFERAHPDHPRRSAAAAADRRAREAPDRVRRRRVARHRPARQHVDSRARHARRARAAAESYVDASTAVPHDDYFAGIWDTNVIGGRLYGVPWYIDTRLLFYRKDLLARAGFRRAAARLERMDTRARRREGERGRRQLRDLPAAQRIRAAVESRRAGAGSAAARQRHARQFRERRIPARIRLLRRHVPPRLGAADEQHRNLERLGRVRKRLLHVLHHRAVERRRVRRRLPAALQDDWATAPLPGPDGPGAAIGGGSSLVMFLQLAGTSARSGS